MKYKKTGILNYIEYKKPSNVIISRVKALFHLKQLERFLLNELFGTTEI